VGLLLAVSMLATAAAAENWNEPTPIAEVPSAAAIVDYQPVHVTGVDISRVLVVNSFAYAVPEPAATAAAFFAEDRGRRDTHTACFTCHTQFLARRTALYWLEPKADERPTSKRT